MAANCAADTGTSAIKSAIPNSAATCRQRETKYPPLIICICATGSGALMPPDYTAVPSQPACREPHRVRAPSYSLVVTASHRINMVSF